MNKILCLVLSHSIVFSGSCRTSAGHLGSQTNEVGISSTNWYQGLPEWMQDRIVAAERLNVETLQSKDMQLYHVREAELTKIGYPQYLLLKDENKTRDANSQHKFAFGPRVPHHTAPFAFAVNVEGSDRQKPNSLELKVRVVDVGSGQFIRRANFQLELPTLDATADRNSIEGAIATLEKAQMAMMDKVNAWSSELINRADSDFRKAGGVVTPGLVPPILSACFLLATSMGFLALVTYGAERRVAGPVPFLLAAVVISLAGAAKFWGDPTKPIQVRNAN